MKPPMMNSEEPMDKQEDDMEETKDMTPMDEAISMVDSYIKNPKLATPETLGNLKSMLQDMKPMIDGDDREGMDEETDTNDYEGDEEMDKKCNGLTIVIGQMKKRGEGK